jgi:hypothetical protein
MADVISMKEYLSIRFFSEDVVCGHCERDTRGRVYDSGEAVLCSECGGPLITIGPAEYTGFTIVTFSPEE